MMKIFVGIFGVFDRELCLVSQYQVINFLNIDIMQYTYADALAW